MGIHLYSISSTDVYKRQALDGKGGVRLPGLGHGEGAARPVSYTHLDVYKRQVLRRPHQGQERAGLGGRVRHRGDVRRQLELAEEEP